MPGVRELFTDAGLPTLRLVGASTGLTDLDHLTHGMLPGALWVIAGTPGAGRTTLACQLAGHVAAQGASAALISARDDPDTLLTNLVVRQAKVPAQHVQRGTLSDLEQERLAASMAVLAEADLQLLSATDSVWEYPDGAGTADFGSLARSGRRVADLLVVDDVDELLGAHWTHTLNDLRTWARQRGFTLVLTAPEEGLVHAGRCHPDLRRHADVVLRLELPGQFDLDDPRVGEADLTVLRNRRGPQGRITVHFQGHYRRFVDA